MTPEEKFTLRVRVEKGQEDTLEAISELLNDIQHLEAEVRELTIDNDRLYRQAHERQAVINQLEQKAGQAVAEHTQVLRSRNEEIAGLIQLLNRFGRSA